MILNRCLPVFGILLMACAGSDGRLYDVAIETIGDTTIVRSRQPQWLDTAELVPELTIGQLDGPEQYQFSSIISFTADGAGALYVYDSDFGEIRKYDESGRFVHRFGRSGGGPGEYRFVSGMAVLPDGRLVALDPGNDRLNVYAPDGTSLTHWPHPRSRSTYGRFALQTDDTGQLYFGLNVPLPRDGSPLPWPRPGFLRLDETGTIIDTVFVPTRFVEQCTVRSEQKYRSGFFDDIRAPYVPKVRWALGQDGALIAGCPSSYTMDVIRASGVTRIIRDDWRAVEASNTELDNYTRRWTLQTRSGMNPDFVWTTDLPDRKPAYQRILVGREGRLWLWTPQPSEEITPDFEMPAGWPPTYWREPSGGFLDVFDKDARYLGVVRLPPNVAYTPDPGSAEPVIMGDVVWAVTFDENDVLSMTRFRLSVPAVGGS